MNWTAFTSRLDRMFHRIGLEPQRSAPFVSRRYRYRRNRRATRAIGPTLMAREAWLAKPDPEYPAGDLARIFQETPGLHKWLHYIPVYEAVLGGLRNQPVRVLEIGVDRGGSLEAWSRYLGAQAIIVGVDVNPFCANFDDPAHNRHVRIGGQQDPALLEQVIAEFGPFDVIIDDGSHRPSHMNASFRGLFDRGLADGGVYIAEDLQTNYWLGFRDAPASFIDLAKGLVDEMHAHYQEVTSEPAFLLGSEERRRSIDVPRITKLVQSIEFFDSMLVIRKADGERDVPVSTYTEDPDIPAQH